MTPLPDGTARRRLEGTPRARVRYTYLLEVWPDAANCASTDHAMLEAPAEAVMAALVMDKDKFSELLQREREARRAAEAELAEIRSSVQTILTFIAGTPA